MQPPEKHLEKQEFSPPVVILVGASVRAAAESARRGGWEVIGIDLFGDCDTREHCVHFHQFVDLDRLREFDSVIPRVQVCVVGDFISPCGVSAFDVAELLSQRGHQQIGSDSVHSQQVKDPRVLAGIAAHAVIRMPYTFDLSSGDSVGELPSRDPRYLFKKKNMSGGLGVHWNAEDTRACYRQAWIPGRACGATVAIFDDQVVVLGICRTHFSRQSNRPFVYAGSTGPVELKASHKDSLSLMGDKLRQLGLRGLVNFDLIADRQGDLWLLEVNPRWSGSCEVIERSMIDRSGDHAFSLFAWSHGRSLGRHDLASLHGEFLIHKRILYARHAVHFRRDVLDEVIEKYRNEVDIEMADIPVDHADIARGCPMFTLLIRVKRAEPVGYGTPTYAALRNIHAMVHRS